MEAPYRCVGSEPSDLALPVAEQGRRADDERVPALPEHVLHDGADGKAGPHDDGFAALDARYTGDVGVPCSRGRAHGADDTAVRPAAAAGADLRTEM